MACGLGHGRDLHRAMQNLSHVVLIFCAAEAISAENFAKKLEGFVKCFYSALAAIFQVVNVFNALV